MTTASSASQSYRAFAPSCTTIGSAGPMTVVDGGFMKKNGRQLPSGSAPPISRMWLR
jgi:hypothetical protein